MARLDLNQQLVSKIYANTQSRMGGCENGAEAQGSALSGVPCNMESERGLRLKGSIFPYRTGPPQGVENCSASTSTATATCQTIY